MRLAKLLFKPKWQDKDAAVRRIAVATGNDAEMIQALSQLVREDADAGVRLAALKRLNDYEHWRERSTGDVDDALRSSARGMYLTLLCANASEPSMTRRIAELDTPAAPELEKVAATAAHRDLRAAALERIVRPGLLVERAVADPDVQLRLAALERIEDPGLLERVAERTRKTDKVVSRRARERLEASRISAGDGTAIGVRARVFCERLEALLRAPRIDMENDLAAIDAAWVGLGAAIPVEISARYRGAHVLVMRSLDLLRNPQSKNVSEPVAEDIEPAPVSTATQELAQAAVTEVLVSQARFDAALAVAQAQARVEQERRKLLHTEIEQLLPSFATAIESGDSAAAHNLHTRIREGLKSLREVPAELHRRLAPMEERLAEMKRWQHWSNNQRLRALCAEIEALSTSGLHPDALATRVREAREEWQRLDAAEGIAAADSETGPGISRRFHALCYQVLRPTKGYFSKRNEVRKSHGAEIEALLERAASIGDDTTDWNTLALLRTETSTALRALDEVDPRTRTALAKRLKEVIARASTLIETHERDVEASKQGLIEQAVALGSRSDHATLPREARELQKRWTALGNGRRNVDQRQWREFRSACDAVFGKLDAARKDRETQVAATLAQVQDVVTELEALARDESAPVESVKTQLRDLDARWQASASDDRALAQRQRQAHDAVTLRIKDSARRRRLGRYTIAMQKYAFLRTIETGNTQSFESWSAFTTTAPAFDVALQARHDLARSASLTQSASTGAEESEAAREILVQLEFLAGIDSPAEDRQRRMSYQVSRLSSRMRSGAAAMPEHELDELLAAWFAQSPQPSPLEERFVHAATAVIDTLP